MSGEWKVTQWSEQEWLAAPDLHQAVLAASDADPLFNSWHWQSLWWRIYGGVVASELCILAVSRAGSIVGIAPFYVARAERRIGVFAVRSLQLIGMAWRNPDALISEYLDIVAVRDCYERVRDLCLEELERRYPRSEIVISSTCASHAWAAALHSRSLQWGGYVRVVDESVSYQAELVDGFDAYVANLSSSARRAMVHSRARLTRRGDVRYSVIPGDELESGLNHLNDLHAQRWGSAAYVGRRLDFHRQFSGVMAHAGALRLSRLEVGGRLVSVLYDIVIGSRQYNLQMGFDQGFASGIALGLLHLGYAIEDAAARRVAVYDFLAGPGKNTDYKRRLATRQLSMSSVQYVRGRCLSRLYRWHDGRSPIPRKE